MSLLLLLLACLLHAADGGSGKLPPPIQHILHRAATLSAHNKTSASGPTFVPATKSNPAMICSQVYGMDGKAGLLCKPIPDDHNGTGMEGATDDVKALAKDLAIQARVLGERPNGAPSMHMEQAMYRWQLSSSFVFVSNRRHYYNVHYADSSALKIKTGQDYILLGPYRVMTRFGLIEEAVSGRPGADLQGADGILGFGYSDWKRSASVMKTMTRRERPSWGITQPSSLSIMQHNVFSVLTSVTAGELQLGGYDRESYEGDLMWTKMMNQTGYGVLITSLKYKDVELLHLGEKGKALGGVLGVFDTGSTCIEMPRGLFAGFYASSLFDNFARLASPDPTHPLEVTLAGGGVLSIPLDVWSEPWGCTNPFKADNVMLFGHHSFKAYMVVHDMSVPEYRMGFAKINKAYLPRIGKTTTHEVPDGGGGIAKVPLSLEARVHLFIDVSIGTPPQRFRCVFDTGSILLAVFSGNVTASMVNRSKLSQLTGSAPTLPLPGWLVRALVLVCFGFIVISAALRFRYRFLRRAGMRTSGERLL